MKYILIGLGFAAGLASLTGCSAGSQTANSAANAMQTADEAAQKVIASLPQLINESNFRTMGFTSLDEVKSARLGISIQKRQIAYQTMVGYKEGSSIDQLFATEAPAVRVFPIQAGDAVRATATVSQQGNTWRISSIGDTRLAELFTAAGGDRTSLELVSIPGLNLEFGSIRRNGQTLLIPAQDVPETSLVKGQAINATEAIPQIAAYARDFDRKYGEQIRNKKLVR